jgi:hypothetical protein
MTQAERDRLVALKKAKKKLITQKQAAEELGITERHVRRLLGALKRRGDKAIVHALRGLPSNRKVDVETQREAVAILTRPVYRGFGPTLASEYLAKKHNIQVSRETVRQWMIEGKLWRARKQRVEKIHEWRPRRGRFGELVQWDTSEHAWLEGRGEGLLLINMIDDATGRWFARFVSSDSTVENMNLLESYVKKHGRPLAFYTDKASLFQTAEKRKRDEPGVEKDAVEMPLTQIGRALRELAIPWIPAHSPQAKGRVERGFLTAQDRLVKGMRVAKVRTLEQTNHYLETEFGEAARSGRHSEPCGKPTREQRLYDPAGYQDLPDRTPRHPHWTARRGRAGRETPRRFGCGSVPRPPLGGLDLRAASQASSTPAGQPGAARAEAQPSQ